MAADDKKKKVRKISYAHIHRLAAATSLVAFVVIIGAGVAAQASVFSITFRAMLAIVVVSIISRILIRILASYEEMNSGKA